MNNDDKALMRVEEAIANIKDNNFTLYFFVVDCKNVPNGSVAYIYQLAKTLHDNGRNVTMLYQLEDEYTASELYKLKKKDMPIDTNRTFVGVEEWLGKEYAELPHMNISTEEWKVSPSDFLFIPEAFSSLMFQTYKYKAPCKRFVILQNYNYVIDFIPLGVEWKNYGIYDAITTTDKQAELIKNVFPYMRTHTINPSIPEYFRKPLKPKNLVVNLVTKYQEDINRIIKPFYWKYPVLKFISFRDLRGYNRSLYADLLKESPITVWVDDETPFGYSALEAMRCGNIVIGKVPDIVPEWMGDDAGLFDNGLWTYDINQIPELLAKAITWWMQDKVPQVLYDTMEEMNKLYTTEQWNSNVEKTFNTIIDEQVNSFKEVKAAIENNKKNED